MLQTLNGSDVLSKLCHYNRRRISCPGNSIVASQILFKSTENVQTQIFIHKYLFALLLLITSFQTFLDHEHIKCHCHHTEAQTPTAAFLQLLQRFYKHAHLLSNFAQDCILWSTVAAFTRWFCYQIKDSFHSPD